MLKNKTEITGPDGGAINQVNYTPEDYAKAQLCLRVNCRIWIDADPSNALASFTVSFFTIPFTHGYHKDGDFFVLNLINQTVSGAA